MKRKFPSLNIGSEVVFVRLGSAEGVRVGANILLIIGWIMSGIGIAGILISTIIGLVAQIVLHCKSL